MENILVTTDEHEMVEHMQVEEQEGDDDYFQDPTDICKYHPLGKICCIQNSVTVFLLSQFQSLTQYPLRGSQSM